MYSTWLWLDICTVTFRYTILYYTILYYTILLLLLLYSTKFFFWDGVYSSHACTTTRTAIIIFNVVGCSLLGQIIELFRRTIFLPTCLFLFKENSMKLQIWYVIGTKTYFDFLSHSALVYCCCCFQVDSNRSACRVKFQFDQYYIFVKHSIESFLLVKWW